MEDYLSELLGPPDREKENPAPVAAGNGVEFLASLENCLSQHTTNWDDLLGPSALDMPFDLSVFPDVHAKSVSVERLSIRQLAGKIRARQADAKSSLPLLKLGTFGASRTERGSLRHDGNLESVSGIEGDYDAGEVSPQEAAERLRRANIAALVYTTPSHAPDAPRWRVLCPLSKEISPGEREALCERVNGALGGILASESFTRSQTYYFGGVAGHAAPSVHLIEGRTIDRASDVPSVPKRLAGREPQRAIETYTEDAEDDWDWGKPDPDWQRIRKALGKIKDASDRDTWLKIGMALKDVSSGSEEHAAEGFRLWCAWSRRCPEKYSEKAQRQTWRSFKRSGTGIGTLFQIAKEWGWTGEAEIPPAAPSRLTFLSPADCEAAPSRGYVIKGLIAPGDVGCVFGAPGAGKSLLSPFLAYAVAQGREAFGQRVRAGGAFYVAAEDPHGMRGRVRALKAAYGDAPGFRLVEGVSNLHPDAPDLVALLEAIETQKPAIVFIDTLAMAFPGLEENSAESMGHVVAIARKLAEGGAAVVLVHHDTKAETGTPRGHSILNGALDVALHVKRDEESGIVRAKLTKNRNGPCDLDIAFSIATEDGGTDEDGDTITLPRCRELSSDPMRVKLTDRQAAAVAILKCIGSDDPSGLIPESRWRDACMAEGALTDSPNRESRGAIFRTTRKELTECGAIVRLVPEGKTEMHVRLSDFTGLDGFDDLPEQGEQGANPAECSVKAWPGQWLGEAEHKPTPLPFRGGLDCSPLPDPNSDPLAELLG